MKTFAAALALLTFAAGPVFAQSDIPSQPDRYLYPLTPDDPAWNVWPHR